MHACIYTYAHTRAHTKKIKNTVMPAISYFIDLITFLRLAKQMLCWVVSDYHFSAVLGYLTFSFLSDFS